MNIDIGMIAADTLRSSAYLQAMIHYEILPSFVILMMNDGNRLPGQNDKNDFEAVQNNNDDEWQDFSFDASRTVQALLEEYDIPYSIAPNANINDSAVIHLISERPEAVFIYSGFGGVILREPVLSIGKEYLHIHGGYLPKYKGSTTNYYSILEEDSMGASAMFMRPEIDDGPVLVRQKFGLPPDSTKIDYIYDSIVRAKVLIQTLQNYIKQKEWVFSEIEKEPSHVYYVIHPVLKHIAILGSMEPSMSADVVASS